MFLYCICIPILNQCIINYSNQNVNFDFWLTKDLKYTYVNVLAEGGPAHGNWVGIWWSLRSLRTQTFVSLCILMCTSKEVLKLKQYFLSKASHYLKNKNKIQGSLNFDSN